MFAMNYYYYYYYIIIVSRCHCFCEHRMQSGFTETSFSNFHAVLEFAA